MFKSKLMLLTAVLIFGTLAVFVRNYRKFVFDNCNDVFKRKNIFFSNKKE